MKNGRLRAVMMTAAVLVCVILAWRAHATNWVLALPAKPQDGAKAAETELVQSLYRKLGAGDVLIAYNAGGQSVIARVEMPSDPVMVNNRNLKARLINGEFGKIWDFIDRVETAQGAPGNVAIPRFLITLPSLLDTLPEHTAQVVIAGSALYDDPREPTFSMKGGYLPTDAHLLVAQERSPYSTAGREKALQGATIHVCYTNPQADWTTDLFQQRTGRLWALEILQQGGRFGAFAPLDGGCIAGFLAGTASSETFALDRTETKLTMHKFERAIAREEPLAPTAPPPRTAPETPEALFQRPPCTSAPTVSTGPMRIGIKWDCPSCDLDLYARSRAQSEWLYFDHRVPSDGNGYFDHDWTRPPPGGDAYEYVQFNNVDLLEVAARVNFFNGGERNGPRFRLRVWFAGCAYDAPPFHITASTGNGGASAPPDAHWVTIDVAGIVGLRRTGAAAQ